MLTTGAPTTPCGASVTRYGTGESSRTGAPVASTMPGATPCAPDAPGSTVMVRSPWWTGRRASARAGRPLASTRSTARSRSATMPTRAAGSNCVAGRVGPMRLPDSITSTCMASSTRLALVRMYPASSTIVPAPTSRCMFRTPLTRSVPYAVATTCTTLRATWLATRSARGETTREFHLVGGRLREDGAGHCGHHHAGRAGRSHIPGQRCSRHHAASPVDVRHEHGARHLIVDDEIGLVPAVGAGVLRVLDDGQHAPGGRRVQRPLRSRRRAVAPAGNAPAASAPPSSASVQSLVSSDAPRLGRHLAVLTERVWRMCGRTMRGLWRYSRSANL